MQLGYSNRHHGVPRSFLGSSDQSNLSLVDAEEHGLFHAMAGHLPPDYLMRRAILSAADWTDKEGKALPAPLFEGMLAELTPSDWKQLYQPGTIRETFQDVYEEVTFAKAAIHVQMQICREQYDVADALHATLREKHLSPKRVAFRHAMGSFFYHTNPADAIRQYLLDVNEHDIKWVKPLSMSVRSHVFNVLREGKPERPARNRRRDIYDSLEDHRDRLITCMERWEPRVSEFETVIAHNRAIPFFNQFLNVRSGQLSG